MAKRNPSTPGRTSTIFFFLLGLRGFLRTKSVELAFEMGGSVSFVRYTIGRHKVVENRYSLYTLKEY